MPKLNPLLESDAIECAHKGKVLLQSSTKDLMCVQDSNNSDVGMISLSDLANTSIVGCTNNIAGIPSPCTKLVNIPNSIASTLLEIDNQKIIIAQYISQVITDKGSPLILQGEPKAKDIFEVDEDNAENVQNGNDSAESASESSEDSNADSNESNAKSNADSSNSQSTQDSQSQKEILKMYFSYGEEMIKLEGDDSRFTKDINLHLVTQGYNKGEVVDIKLKRNKKAFSIKATIDEDGKALIKNVFNN